MKFEVDYKYATISKIERELSNLIKKNDEFPQSYSDAIDAISRYVDELHKYLEELNQQEEKVSKACNDYMYMQKEASKKIDNYERELRGLRKPQTVTVTISYYVGSELHERKETHIEDPDKDRRKELEKRISNCSKFIQDISLYCDKCNQLLNDITSEKDSVQSEISKISESLNDVFDGYAELSSALSETIDSIITTLAKCQSCVESVASSITSIPNRSNLSERIKLFNPIVNVPLSSISSFNIVSDNNDVLNNNVDIFDYRCIKVNSNKDIAEVKIKYGDFEYETFKSEFLDFLTKNQHFILKVSITKLKEFWDDMLIFLSSNGFNPIKENGKYIFDLYREVSFING